MKNGSTVRYVLRLAVTLLLITSVTGALLAAVNGITAPIIDSAARAKTQAAVAAVLPGGGAEISFTDDTGMVQKVYASQAGYAVQVRADGFNGPVVMMVGVSPEGTVLAVSIVSHSETPNLGAVAGDDSAQGRAFRDQYTGMSGTLAVTKDGGQVDAITGATITSRAVTEGINAALACVAGLG